MERDSIRQGAVAVLDELDNGFPFENRLAPYMQEMLAFPQDASGYHAADRLFRPWPQAGEFPNRYVGIWLARNLMET